MALAGVVAAALALGGCGDEEAESEGPVSLVPADAPLYFESVANIEGDDAEGLADALSTLGVDDPAAMLGEQLDAALEADGAPINYTDDIEPLLGDRAGLFVESFEAEGSGALIIETTDEDGARERVDELIAESDDPAEDATHGGVDYKLNPTDGNAVAVFDGFVVGGTEASVQAAIDSSNGDSLADSEEYQSELEGGVDDPVFTAYANVASILDGLVESGQLGGAERGVVEQSLGGVADVPALLSVGADSDDVTVEASFGIADPEARVAAEESELLRALPGDAWGAAAVPELGAAVERTIEQLESTAGALAPDIAQEFRRETGLDLARLAAAIGDVAVFVRGTNVLDVGGGAVIEDLDPSITADALETLRRLAEREGEEVGPLDVEGEGFAIQPPGAPQRVNFVQRNDRLVVAYGDEATERAFEPSEALGEADAFGAAAAALGEGYSVAFFLDAGPALELADSAGAASDPGFAQAEPYLEQVDYLVTGALSEEERDRVRIVLGLE